jgi:hypothetical protein
VARRFAAIVLVAGLLGAGCKMTWCVEGLELGHSYRTTVLDRATSDSIYGVRSERGAEFGMQVSGSTCGANFDLIPGSTFVVKPVSKVDCLDCYGRLGVVSGVSEIQLAEEVTFPVRAAGELMRSPVYRAYHGDTCDGEWQLDYLSSYHDSPLEPPVPGSYPAVVLLRYFNASLGSCVAEFGGDAIGCDDYFVISLEAI